VDLITNYRFWDVGSLDETFGYSSINARILVDGKVGGKVEVRLLPRFKGMDYFHRMRDSISADLEIVAHTFFTNSGKPRASVPSVHQALTAEKKSMSPLLYIDVFEVNVEYRTWPYTNMGARALQSLLTDTALAKGWSLVMYVPDGGPQFSEQDTIRQEDNSSRRG
jgi:hypothetical protein